MANYSVDDHLQQILGWEVTVPDASSDIEVDARRCRLAHVARLWDVGNNWFVTVVAATARRMRVPARAYFASAVVMATPLPSLGQDFGTGRCQLQLADTHLIRGGAHWGVLTRGIAWMASQPSRPITAIAHLACRIIDPFSVCDYFMS